MIRRLWLWMGAGFAMVCVPPIAALASPSLHVGQLAPAGPLLAAAASCAVEVKLIAMPVADARTSEAQAAQIVAAKRSFSLLEPETAAAQLGPVLQALRQAHLRDRWRVEAELLAARIADMMGDISGYDAAIRALAELHLLGELNDGAWPPAVLQDVEAVRRATWMAGVVRVTVTPRPTTIQVDGHTLVANDDGFDLPLALQEPLRLRLTWNEIGPWELAWRGEPTLTPLAYAAVVERWPQAPPWLWLPAREGHAELVSSQTGIVAWRATEPPSLLCKQFATAVSAVTTSPPPPALEPTQTALHDARTRRRRIWIGVGTALLAGAAAGVGVTLAGGDAPATGTLTLRW